LANEEEAELAAKAGEAIIAKAAKDAFEDAEKVVAEDVGKDAAQDVTRDATRDIDGWVNPRELQRTHEIGGNASSRNVMNYRDSMMKDGWQGDPVTVVEHDGQKYLVDGHHRRAAAIRAGLDRVPYKTVELPHGNYRSLDDVLGYVRPDNLRYKGKPF
jgi:hypothetical protein